MIPDWFAGDLKRVLTDWPTPEIAAYAIHRTEARGAAKIRVVLDALAEAVSTL
jgi:DNA-binding transcriptional LysR family regulator